MILLRVSRDSSAQSAGSKGELRSRRPGGAELPSSWWAERDERGGPRDSTQGQGHSSTAARTQLGLSLTDPQGDVKSSGVDDSTNVQRMKSVFHCCSVIILPPR